MRSFGHIFNQPDGFSKASCYPVSYKEKDNQRIVLLFLEYGIVLNKLKYTSYFK